MWNIHLPLPPVPWLVIGLDLGTKYGDGGDMITSTNLHSTGGWGRDLRIATCELRTAAMEMTGR
jgi:hypothetical protein